MQEKDHLRIFPTAWKGFEHFHIFSPTPELQTLLRQPDLILEQASTVSNIFLYKKLSVPHLSQGCAVCHPNRACPSVPSHLRSVVLTTAEPVM